MHWPFLHRVRAAKEAKIDVVDVDGTYLYRKCQQLGHNTVIPDPPFTGWVIVNESNHCNVARKMPNVTHGTYTCTCI